MKYPMWILGVLVSVSFTILSCSTAQVSQDYDRDYAFMSNTNYAWLPAEIQEQHLEKPRNSIFEKRLKSAVNGTINTKGFSEVSVDQADLIIAYHTSLKEKQSIQQLGYGMGPMYYPSNISVDRLGNVRMDRSMMNDTALVSYYNEGTLILDFYDKATKDLVWRGTLVKVIDDNMTPEEKDELIHSAATQILASFPPGQVASS